MPVGLAGFDKRQIGSADSLVGIDEAGRGCLAGPVVAAAVQCNRDFYGTSWCSRNSRMVDDSKRLQPEQRQAVIKRFKYAVSKGWIRIGMGTASVEEIEKFNIYHANSLAMRRAFENVVKANAHPLWQTSRDALKPIPVLIDGKPVRSFPVMHTAVVKGDQKSLAIALAGIHAKEYRDSLMHELDHHYPGYGFQRHKGYGTKVHVEAIRRLGPSPHHRPSFLVKMNATNATELTHRQDSLF